MKSSGTNGLSNAAVARELRTTGFTVGFCRNRLIAQGVVGLGDEPRPGAPRQIGDEEIEQMVRLTLEKTPNGATHWSARTLAARTGFSQSSAGRIWRAFGLKPHRSESFQLSADPLLIDKVRDIVGLYLNPPITPWYWRSTRSRRFKLSAAANQCCPSGRGNSSGVRRTISGMA